MTQNPIDTFQRIETAAHDGDFGHNSRPQPTDAMCLAGNYKVGKTSIYGLSVAIEQSRHNYRTGVDPKTGKRWSTRLAAHYGYFQRTIGADGDPIDCFIGFYPQAEHAWVINQYVGSKWDEHKVMLAFPDEQTARRAYRRALFLGTTGAGKTTALRQIMGTDPLKERFPSTSPAKTTVHETEVILREGIYSAVITFFPMEDVREHLKECVSAAVLAAYRKESEADQMRRLLKHVNQRFRFNYVLGNGPVKDTSDFDDDADSNNEPEDSELLISTNKVLSFALESLKNLAERYGTSLRTELNATDEKDQRVIDELFEEELDNRTRDDETFQQVVDAIMDEIEGRFSLLPDGKLQKTKVGWPLSWTWETEDRNAFIAAISRFASNYSPLFGTLLTPLVNGVRVAGPFYPVWTNEKPKLVLLDGEGLGHTPRSMSTISTTLSKRIDMVDAVILVDNATQPMLSAPVAAMKELVSSGNSAKLIFAFTHFDKVSGDNLPSPIQGINYQL